MNKKLIKKILIGFCIVILLVIVDQWSKLLAVDRLKDQNSFEVIKNLLTFEYAENPGAAFSSFLNQQTFLCIITVVALFIFMYYLITCKDRITFVGILLAIGGTIGNFIDRIRLEYVVDFIHLSFFSPIFNVADICLTVGIALIVIMIVKDGVISLKEENK